MSAGPPVIEASFAGRLGAFDVDASFTIPGRGVTALFGPSGCGKTTVLRCLAGLQRLGGRLVVGGEVWQDDAAGMFKPPHRRPIGYVFQEASLFPHLSVRKNLLYGAARAGGRSTGELGFEDTVALLGIGTLLDRAPAALSGGERQRVAMGRALLSRPRLLLMDEPLAALDRQTKDDILPYLEALHARLSIPIVYVSHDIAEVERLADTLVLMERGRATAVGRLADLQADPALPLLQPAEAAVTLEGRIAGTDDVYGLTLLDIEGGPLVVPGLHGPVGGRRRLRIRVSDVSFVLSRPEATTILNCLPVRILEAAPAGEGGAQVTLIAGLGEDGTGARIAARITRKSRDALGLEPGCRAYAQIKSVALLASQAGAD
jgi:molybdate transport system ATP-binding protein